MDPKIIEYKNDVLENRATLVITNLNEVRIYHQTGIKDAFNLKKRAEDLKGFIAVEKITGKASLALLYSMGVREIHSLTATNSAIEFSKTLPDLSLTSDAQISSIKKEGTSEDCPIDKAVKDLNTIKEINDTVKKVVAEIKAQEGTGTIVLK